MLYEKYFNNFLSALSLDATFLCKSDKRSRTSLIKYIFRNILNGRKNVKNDIIGSIRIVMS